MTELGALYANGQGVPPDDAKATAWLDKATAGDAFAMFDIGSRYAEGRGLPKSYPKARTWFEKAAAAGHIEALGDLAWHALLARQYADALDAAERGLKANSTLVWIATNRAHALMLLGRAAEAREVYLAYKDRQLAQPGSKTWQQGIADDFAALRKAGLEHPQMAEIEAVLGIAKR
jgi:TPR repeat protein